MSKKILLEGIQFAHRYTCHLIDAIAQDDWFRIPPAGVSHVAWQVGHLAVAAYRITLDRIRGPKPGDEELMTDRLLAQFGYDTVPESDPVLYPSIPEILTYYTRVHAQIQTEFSEITEETLDLPPLRPHPLCPTQRACLVWCSHHEMLHAGQIGLLRRQLGHPPLSL